VVTDALAPEALLEHVREGAEIVRAGKRAGDEPEMRQREINALLVDRARAGKQVVRMKGGDPFVFGRGGEEAEHLASAGVPFEVVPGVSSAVAVPAYAGIPLTHRDHAQSFAVITGHPRADAHGDEDHASPTPAERAYGAARDVDLAWDTLARGAGTIVFLMGMTRLEENARRLIEGGRRADTPAAAIMWGTTPRQRVVVATLETIAERARAEGLHPPVVVVVGDVVALRERLSWYERAPLFGRRVLVTRARDQASSLRGSLARLGADPILLPTIEVVPPDSFAALDAAIRALRGYTDLVFTSPNGVRFFWRRLGALGFDARHLAGLRVSCIGPGTADAVAAHGVRPDLVAPEFRAEGLVLALREGGLSGRRFLVARAERARELLLDELRAGGATVDLAVAYRTVVPAAAAAMRERLAAGEPLDAITFTSASTVHRFVDVMGDDAARALAARAVVACIGPVTRDAAIARGLGCAVMPERYTIPALVEALAVFFAT
jgi:uroporphyrinogen III methyltransferase/synthase